jgi:probable rRNA maturation factor
MAVEIVSRARAAGISPGRLKAKAQRILSFFKRSDAELSLALVNNRQIRRLNARYRKKDRATDVLSFPAEDLSAMGVRLLGDVVISVERARSQAKERGKTLEEELDTLLIHGILHLLGYDHERSERDAEIMERLERRVRRGLCRGSGQRV